MVMANGKSFKEMKIATALRGSMKMIRKMAKVLSNGNQEMSTQELTWTMKDMAMEKCGGLTALSTKVNGSKAFNTAKVA